MLYIVGENEKGRAVFANYSIKKGHVIMTCPVLVFNAEKTAILRETILDDYIFDWPSSNERIDSNEWTSSAVVLGDGSLLNHSSDPNAGWTINRSKNQVIYTAIRDISFFNVA